MSSTISDILASQSSLVEEAAEALPFQFTQCTHSLGPIRQAVYLCTTCAVPRGICAACSVACHTDHEQLELFPKRNFRCDCPTSSITHQCTLHTNPEEENTENMYGQNFKGLFCRCSRTYDAQTEPETMIQCLACEDWFHESCLNLRERPPAREPSPEPISDQSDADNDDAASDASSSGLPPPLIPGTSYDAFVCSSCVQRISVLHKFAGTPGVLMVVRDTPSSPWKVIGADELSGDKENVDVAVNGDSGAVAGQKRPRSQSEGDGVQAKRPREEAETSEVKTQQICLAPSPNTMVKEILSSLGSSQQSPLGAGDVFLTEGFRERWCRCSECLPILEAHQYLLETEETYEPPEDPDSGLSLEELGMRALQRLPRDRAIDGIMAFNQMRDELMNHLRPFAQEGKEVTEADIRGFFDAKLAAKSS
ncbi:hypothetical protein EIP91_008069 [Steccherinum ochraceum]|uniref:UBR-type domain-containing protein n=1 Tax=Steccherinum ochraceum TaxID=92696 RepID=A0A4R0RQ55_9APHY|nr:hypothetical protein EIP91_008069 [Steccherinum ochraceum]